MATDEKTPLEQAIAETAEYLSNHGFKTWPPDEVYSKAETTDLKTAVAMNELADYLNKHGGVPDEVYYQGYVYRKDGTCQRIVTDDGDEG